MKRTLLSFSMLFIAFTIFGQAQDGTVRYQKSDQPAATIELAYSPDVVTAAMNDHLSKKGKSKGNDIKGFTTFRNMQSSLNDSANADLYFKMERKSRKEKEVTVVSLLLTHPKDGAEKGSIRHLDMDEAKTYLNELVPAIEAYNLEAEIKKQNESVLAAELKLKNIAADNSDLEKKRKSLEKNIEEYKQKIDKNNSHQQDQLREIENQKSKLAELVNRRKS